MDSTAAGTRQWQQLNDWRSSELAALFASLDTGALPQGRLRGRLMALRGTHRLPRPLARLLNGLLSLPLNPWRGKVFSGHGGSNLWGTLSGPRFGHYRTRLDTGFDGRPSLWLDYDQASNPSLLRRIRGEARQLQTGLWLCCMHWQGRDQLHTLLWFTLEDTGHGA